MGADYFSLAVPLIVFTVLLLDINRHMEEYSEDKASKTGFVLARFIVILALVISVILGLMEILGLGPSYSLLNYSKTFNLLVLVGYLIFTRFKRK